MNLYLTYPSNDTDPICEGTFLNFGRVFSLYDMLLDYSGDLEDLARKSGVTPLSEFTNIEGNTQWFEPADAIKTVNILLHSLPTTDVAEADELLATLSRLQQELKMLQATGRGFAFGIG